jgi:DNA-binding transcriptional LysR family regulator
LLDEGCELPQVVVETWSTVVIVNLLQTSDWLAVLPRSIARQHAKAGSIAVLPFVLPDALLPLAVITRRGVAGTEELLAALVESVQTAATECAGPAGAAGAADGAGKGIGAAGAAVQH